MTSRTDPSPIDLRAMTAVVDRVATALARSEGLRAALEARSAQIERDVGLAKGRLAVKSEVEAFLEELQTEASRRNVTRFEALLTALVSEVLPGEKPVALDLSTERGMPALDINVMRPDGGREDVLEDQGGAMTNVIGMGLRLIAVVKSRAAPFLVLDEADCWIAPDRVPDFYRILQDSATRLGVQCLAISHHDVSKFSAGMRVSRIQGHPDQGVTFSCGDPEPTWDSDQKGFRSIRLLNLQGYPDSKLLLSPGVNALIGPNNHGKSTIVRALRALFYGEGRDSLVRRGEKFAAVEMEIEGGRLLRFSRQPRRNPVNVWSLHEADGSVVDWNGTSLETGGKAPPAWLEAMFGISKIEGLDVHIAHQKFPVFLLGEPASKRATVLSIGQESSYVREMLAIHKDRCTRDAQTVREGERELARVRDQLTALEGTTVLRERIETARSMIDAIEDRSRTVTRIVELASALARTRTALSRHRTKSTILADLPTDAWLAETTEALRSWDAHTRQAESVIELGRRHRQLRQRLDFLTPLPSGEPAITGTEAAIDLGKALKSRRTALDQASRRAEALASMPAFPDISDSTAAQALLQSLAKAREEIGGTRQALDEATHQLQALRSQLNDVVAGAGGACPACGQAVADPEILLQEHDHA